MIVSHKNKFVFVKPGKTAGSSIELTLSQLCGSHDLVTKLRARDEVSRPPCPAEIGHPKYIHVDTGDELILQNHAPYGTALQIFGEAIVDYDVICSERNPWEKAISSFYWKGNRRPHLPEKPRFKRFVRDGRFPQDFDVYSLYGVPVVDHVLRVESLQRDMTALLRKLEVPDDEIKVIRGAKAFTRPDHATREEMYQKPWMIRTVAEATEAMRAFLPFTFDSREAPDYSLSGERHTVRYRFLEENQCGPEYWQRCDQ